MNKVMQTILCRRSCRTFRRETPARELIERILQAGQWAPTGKNRQSVHFLVIGDHKIRSELRARVQSAFARMEWRDELDSSLKHSIKQSRMGIYDYDYHAPVLVVVANKRDNPNAMADSACAIQNMMLAAESIGVGSCWINQLHWLDGEKTIRRYLESLGLAPDETICGAVALGIRDGERPAPPERTGMTITWLPDPDQWEN